MQNSSLLSWVVVLFAVGPSLGQEPQASIDIGGPRKAKASVLLTENDYVIRLRMLPVTSFDKATNAQLNRQKARQLALWALGKHLSSKGSVEFYVSGAQVEKVEAAKELYSLTLRVPRKGVSLVRAGEKSPATQNEKDRISFSSALFTRKQDYLEQLHILAESVRDDVKCAADKLKEDEEKDAKFAAAAAEIEKRWSENLKALGLDIQGDLLLFTMDQEELGRAIEGENRRVREYIQQAAKKQNTEEKKKSP